MEKRIVKLADLLARRSEVEIEPGQFLEVGGIPLKEMIQILLGETDSFLTLYAAGLEGKTDTQSLTPFLMSCPSLVAKIIAYASGDPTQAEAVEQNMPATVQLIALSEIWKLSVPDAKKAQELLSTVTALLQKLVEKKKKSGEEKPTPKLQLENLPIT